MEQAIYLITGIMPSGKSIGLWLDTSCMTAEQTVEGIMSRAEREACICYINTNRRG